MAEQLINEFTVNRPIDEAWPLITDLERIAPCLPGAELQEVEGETYRGVVKVKLGAISSQFKGEAHFVERDDENYRAVIKGAGRDTGGRGNASAEITAQAEALSPTSTRVEVTTDLHITGKVAQFGRGIMGDVSSKLMAQFADNLNQMIDEQSVAAPDATAEPAPVDVRSGRRRRHRPHGSQDRGAGDRADRPDGGRRQLDRQARRTGDHRHHRAAASSCDAVATDERSGSRRAAARPRTPRARSTSSFATTPATRSSCATHRCSTTAPRCRRGTTSSAPTSSAR